MPEIVEVRCPVGFRRLFTRMQLGELEYRYVEHGNWLEFSCDDCARLLERDGSPRRRVLHRYNFLGELVETISVPRMTNSSSD
jgi:hypothetical protein